MAKDIIFMETPRFPILRQRVKKHLNANEIIEKMKETIQCATTLRNAAAILHHDFPFADPLTIYAALRESFDVSNEEIGSCL